MEKGNKQPVGSLKISQDVVATISKVAALEVEGVDSLAEPGHSIKLFSKGPGKKAISINLSDDFAEIDLGLNLEFGAKIPEVCAQVQNSVKDNVQTMTGLAVSKVNVAVVGIVFPRENGETA